MPSKKIIFLFAPKFREFGVDIAKRFIRENPDWQIGGICAGGSRTVDFVRKSLKSEALFGVWDIEKKESEWLDVKMIDKELLGRIDSSLGIGASGEIITSDRRIGVGYVRGGECRPDKFGDLSRKNSVEVPLKYLQGLYTFLINLFDEHQPEIVFCYAVAGAPATALGLLCQKKQIKFLKFNTTRIADGYILDDDYKGRLNPIKRTFDSSGYTEPNLIQARKYLEQYRQKPSQPEYMTFNKANISTNHLWLLTNQLFKYSIRLVINKLTFKNNESFNWVGFQRKVFQLKQEWNKNKIKIDNFDQLSDGYRYIYYPLHVDPEASTMVLSPMHTDQVSVIEALSKSLSGDMVLVVKDHLPMLGKRPKGFYELIKKIPRVILLSPFYDSLTLIKNSEGVAVITGTAAFEALLLKKKAIVIGDSPYLALGKGIIHETSLANLPQAIASLSDIELADDETLIRYLASAFSNAFTLKTSILWGKYNDVSEIDKEKVITAIVNKISQELG